MDDYGRAHLLAEMDQVVLRVGQSTAHIAAQEERITASKGRGDDTADSEKFLGVMIHCLRLHEMHYANLLVRFDRLL